MMASQSGHLTHSPSGTRLALSGAAIGLRAFLNQAMEGAYKFRVRGAKCGVPGFALSTNPAPRTSHSALSGSRHVVPSPFPHPIDLPDEIVERLVTGFRIEL